MPRVLFIASHRLGRSPNQRFRFEQYLGHLERNGFEWELSFIVEESDDRFLYRPGQLWNKLGFISRSFMKRRRDVARMDDFDIVFICREALMTRSTYFESAFAKGRPRVIFDFDDAIWLGNVSDANRRWKWMKDPGKTRRIIGMADMVFAGNEYLANYARRSNDRVHVIPTTIDTDEYKPVQQPGGRQRPVCIGWSGSITTIQHFQYAIPALREIKARHGDAISIRVIGDADYRNEDLNVKGMAWRKDTEQEDLAAIDIGIMPLPDDEWARGKCGLKGLQYMGMGIPAIMSPVGVNSSIIQDGVNGYLAGDTRDWVEKISRLVDDAELRARIGAQARTTVERSYSVKAWRDEYLRLFNELLER
jgi:glycosyltransferase involved in cell wall biosynthesis